MLPVSSPSSTTPASSALLFKSNILSFVLIFLAAIGQTSCSSEAASDSKKKDRGEAAMSLNMFEWQASSASAKLTNGKLTINASGSQRTEGTTQRQTLILQIPDFTGTGDYVVSSGSMFVGVGIDIAALTAADKDDEAANKAAVEMLSKAKTLMLYGAKVTITDVSDVEISGTFSCQLPPELKQPEIRNGTFRALIKP